jgi:hypothetical protein
MANSISFLCHWCQETNWVDRGEVENNIGGCSLPIRCWKCGRVQFPNAIKNFDTPGHENENWLECIAYEGPMKKVPTGAITVNGVTQYITADGRIMTRGEFINEFKNDPAKYIIERIKMHQRFNFGRSRF